MNADRPRTGDGQVVFSTRWFEVVAKTCPGWRDPYYMVRSSDCVTVLAVTAAGKILLVEQFRPALGRSSLELPSGHLETGGESPEAAARRELLEETGYCADELKLLGVLDPDTGRLSVRLWCFLARNVRKEREAQDGEERIEVSECTMEEFLEYARQGKLRHAQDLAVALLALCRNEIGAASLRQEETES